MSAFDVGALTTKLDALVRTTPTDKYIHQVHRRVFGVFTSGNTQLCSECFQGVEQLFAINTRLDHFHELSPKVIRFASYDRRAEVVR